MEGASTTDWIQAISAGVIVLLTGVLAYYTRRYVRLTGDLAEVARQQVELSREQMEITEGLRDPAEKLISSARLPWETRPSSEP